MSWNYRIVRYADGSGFGLHEVYYDDRGLPWGMTERPCALTCGAEEGPKGIIESLMMATVDAKKRPVFDVPKEWPGRNPADRFDLDALREATDGQVTDRH